MLETIEDNDLDDELRYDELRLSQISVEVEEGERIDNNDLPTFYVDYAPECDGSYAYIRQYVAALTGAFDEYRTIKVRLEENHISFLIAAFEANGEQKKSNVIILKNLPCWAKLVIKLEPMKGQGSECPYEPDRYVIRNKAASGGPMKLVVEDYYDGELLQTRELGHDDKGNYEIISEKTEAETPANDGREK